MSDIYIPEFALKDEDEFKKYILNLHAHLFKGKVFGPYKPDLPEKFENQLKLLEDVMQVVSFYITGKLEVPPYRAKNKKCNSEITKILIMTCEIIRTHFIIRNIQIARLLNVNHTTITYYGHRFNDFCVYKDFKYLYVRIVLDLVKRKILTEVKLYTREFRDIKHLLEKKVVL